MPQPDVFGTVLLAALVFKFTDFLKNLRAANWNAVVTQLIVWGAATAGVFFLSASDFGRTVIPGLERALDDVDGTTKLLLGVMGGSFASTGFDFKKALDKSDSAVQPPLLP